MGNKTEQKSGRVEKLGFLLDGAQSTNIRTSVDQRWVSDHYKKLRFLSRFWLVFF